MAAETALPIPVPRSAVEPVVPESESTNAWPDEAAESAFLAESRQNGSAPPPTTSVPTVVDAEANLPLPKLDELVDRIPAEARELLEELFRAKFTTVRRIKPADLKST